MSEDETTPPAGRPPDQSVGDSTDTVPAPSRGPPTDTAPASSRGPPTGDRPANQSRRRLLQALAIGGALSLAGCGQNPSSTPTGDSGTVDQTFRLPTGNDPQKTTFYGRHTLNAHLSAVYRTRVLENAGQTLQRLVWETGIWTEGLFAGTDEVYYNWIEKPIEISPTEVTVRIRDDARWSDGTQVTGEDVACLEIQQSIRNGRPPYYADEGPDVPRIIWTAFDDFTIDDRAVTYTSSAGHFDRFWDVHIKNQLGTYLGPHLVPTHVEPYKSYSDAVIETANRAQSGEINPWKGHDDPRTEPDDPHKRVLVDTHLSDAKYLDKFSEPDNVLATGAWNLVELDGSEFVFEPNEHHRTYDELNFDTLVAEFTPSADRMRTAIKADELDLGSSTFGPPTPPAVVDSFPDTITELLVPGNQYTGTEIALNFDHPGTGSRAVRAAIMYALDQEAIAANIHPEAAPPITTPGADCWDATEWASRDWLDENLITYDTDRDRAATLMRETGFTRSDGQWHGADGQTLEMTLATSSDTPLWEPTVASQLGQFGIETTVRTLEANAYSKRVDAGEFPLWNSGLNSATNLAPYTLFVWLFAATSRNKYGLFPAEQFGKGRMSHGVPVPRSEERYRDFTIQAPPVGQPGNSHREYHPAAMALFFESNPPVEEFRRRVRAGMWLANWYLPTIPIARKREQFFIDEAHWQWPTDAKWWESFTDGGVMYASAQFARGTVRANPDKPE